jgi:preprotein translocase subunit SecA
MDHIDMMDHLRQTVGLRAYAQKDPVMEYKFEGARLFDEMIELIKADTVRYVFLAEFKQQPVRREQNYHMTATTGSSRQQDEKKKAEPVRAQNKVGRNDLCPCGSGKKYKKCCGA